MHVVATAVALIVLGTTGPVFAETNYPDLRGTWTGDSEAIVAGTTNHYVEPSEPRKPALRSVPFTIVVDMQEGRRFSGTVTSEHSSERIVGVISQSGMVYWVDEDGYNHAQLLDDDTLEVCYLQVDKVVQVASCVDMKRQS
jgi:hypothetical protein